MSPIQHEAYSFAVREYKALGITGDPDATEYPLLLNLVERMLRREHPTLSDEAILGAARFGVASAVRDLVAEHVPGGIVDTIGGTIAEAPGVVEEAGKAIAGTAEEAAKAIAGTAEEAAKAIAGGTVALATDALRGWSKLTKELARGLPAHLHSSGNYRKATAAQIRRISKAPAKTATAPAASSPSRYYTYAKDVPLGPGETLHFATGKGYYAAAGKAA
jgi:hypothetical protein